MACLNSLLFLVTCVAVCSALPAQQFRKTSEGRNSTRPSGTYGLDLSTAFSKTDFECLKGQGFEFAIIRAYESTGELSYTRILHTL